jgi:hypothetical protein
LIWPLTYRSTVTVGLSETPAAAKAATAPFGTAGLPPAEEVPPQARTVV